MVRLLITLYMFFTFILFGGCIKNSYKEAYRTLNKNLPNYLGHEPIIRPICSSNDVVNAFRNGYVVIGRSDFEGPHCPRICLIDLANNVGADLVLYEELTAGERSYIGYEFCSSYSHSYTYGNLYSGLSSASYNESTSTTTITAIPVERKYTAFSQSALFLKKLDCTNLYGVILDFKPMTPGQTNDSEVEVKIYVVLNNSPAKQNGIKEGDLAQKINGIEIRTYRDAMQFAGYHKLNAIKSIEVKR